MGASFEFLTAQNNFSSNACTVGPQGEGLKKTEPQKVRGLLEMTLGSCSPVAGLSNINASQFELTWETGY